MLFVTVWIRMRLQLFLRILIFRICSCLGGVKMKMIKKVATMIQSVRAKDIRYRILSLFMASILFASTIGQCWLPANAADATNSNGIISLDSEGTFQTAAIGTKIWSDKDYVFTSLPNCLEGVSFVQRSIEGKFNINVEQEGYLYIITPAAGVGDSYAYTLDNYNFKRLDVSMWRFCNAANNNIWLYEKHVQPGDVYNLGRWAVVFSSATQLDFMTGNPIVSDSELAIMESQNGHETRNMTLGSTVFTNRSQYTFYDMPYWLAGKNYIYNPYDTTEKMAKATRAGYVYMLTSTTGNISQVSNLQSQNFEMVTIPTVDLFGGSSQGGAYPDFGFSLLRKYVNVGDTVTWKQWAIPIFSGDLQLSDFMAELTPNADTSKVAKMTSGARLFNNRLYYLQEELPLALDGKSFLYDSIENGGSAKVTKAGKAYIYIPVMTSQYDLETQVKNAGWVQTPYRIFRLSAGLQYGSRLYEKEVTVGEEIHFGKYNLLIHAEMAEQDYYVLPSVSQAAEIITNPEGSKYSVVEQNWLGCPTIERSPEGRLWASWFTGGEYELGLGNFSLISYSGDDGETWKHAAFAVEHPDENVVVTKPEFWTDPNGRLWLFWVQHTGGGNFDGKMGVWASICENPDGVNPVWSTPKRLSDGYLRSKPLVLQNGEWIYSAFDWMTPHETAIYVSTDKGITWNLRGKTECLDTSSGKNNLDDPVLVEKKDGTLWHVIRTDAGPYESFSYDNGKTWTHAVKSSINGPATRMTIDRLASGNLLMVYHDADWRTNLTAYLSTDDGATWSHKLLLDERGNVTYPDTIQSSDGTIYVIYDWGRTSEKEILMATFTEEDVVAGAFNSSVARQKVLINDSLKDKTFYVSTIFSDNMLLQRNKPVKVFGTGGNVGDSVKVTFAGQEKITEITSSEWSVYLDAMEASTIGRTMTIEYIPDREDTPIKTFTYDGIVVGELWLCNGQSNMAFDIGGLTANYPEDMAPYGEIGNLNMLRVYTVPILEAKEPIVYNDGANWVVPEKGKLDRISATALGFASHLQTALGEDVPVGVIVAAQGGSLIEKWLGNQAITNAGTTYSDANSVLYNGMIHQIKGMSIAGILWYQGEANSWAPDLYEKQFTEYVKLYRNIFEDAKLPIVTFQLPQYEVDTTWPNFRQLQWKLTTKIDNLYAVCGIDLGEISDIHPGDKYIFTERAADVAYKYVYATETDNLPGLSPYPNAVYREKDVLRVVFDDATSLRADAVINGFEGYNGSEWITLTAEISGADILLIGDTENITAVRYLYAVKLSDKNMVYNEHGLPVAPFKEFEVEVQKGTVKSIYVTSQPTKTEYYEGEAFDPTGMVVMASYNDGSADASITQYTLSCDELSKDTTKVTISYGGKTTQVAITVKPIDVVEKISLTNNEWKWDEFKIDAIENSKYVAVTMNIKSLVSLDKDAWTNTFVIGMGSDSDNAYSFQLAFGPDNNNQPVNLVKLFQVDNVYEGDTIPLEQWVNERALEQIFSDNGMNVKMLRLDRMVYLQAYMDGEWKLIGRMTLPEDVKSYIHFGNYGTACEFNNVKVSIGKQATLNAFNDVTLEFDDVTQTRYFPINESNWMLEAKVFDTNPTANTDKRLMTVENVSILYQYSNWWTQLTNLWSMNKMSGELSRALASEGLYVRYVCVGDTLRTFLSVDGVHWTKGMIRNGMQEDIYSSKGLTPNPGVIALQSFEPERIEDMKIHIGVEDSDYTSASMLGSRVILGDNIGIDFYMELSEETLNDKNAYMEFVLPGDNHTSEKVMVRNAKAVTQDDKEAYVFSCGIAAKEMASDIKLRIVRGDGTVAEEYIYQVKDYGKVILDDITGTYTQADKDMVKALLNYGSYAQQHFGFNTENLANVVMEEVDRTVEMPTLDASVNYTLAGNVKGLTYYGTSLMLVTNTSIRHYFEVSEGEIGDYTFTCNDKELKPVKKGTRYYVEITDISASELDEMYSLTVTKGAESMTITYGPYTYIKTIVAGNSYNAETKNIMAALYAYSVAAENYFTNSQQ